jgi:very-short-patch-repair endonuclease
MAVAAAAPRGGVLSRRELLRLGVTRWEVTAEVRAQRWHKDGRQTVRVCAGDPALAQWYRALYEVGGQAVLDGISALVAAGLRGVAEGTVHVAVPKSANPQRCRGVLVHETRRYDPASVIPHGVPRMRPAVAAVHGALWAVTDRQAALYVLAGAQQGLFTSAEFAEEVDLIRWDRRRRLLRGLCADLVGGIEALGERDFALLCRQRGLPEPDRQVPRRGPSGNYRYDNIWDAYGLTVEIDGEQHLAPDAWIVDSLKQNLISLQGHTVLRIPNVALRVAPDPFMAQVEEALRRGGWDGKPPRRAE